MFVTLTRTAYQALKGSYWGLARVQIWDYKAQRPVLVESEAPKHRVSMASVLGFVTMAWSQGLE